MPGAVNISGGIPGGSCAGGSVSRSAMFAAERALAAGFTSGGFPPFLAPVAISVGSLPFFSKESSNSA
jgi:hypothetical protein